ncbi:stage II sporulation protein P [Halobacillus sp. BBL2006]|uniref:stage II sporulation protein P n=1 Tax=Halobacillus sp. BBL2006 TaxID=1543706 RepID=UPI0005423E4B|nr:stage II sporulation protein P [Halobacillus sp. BBL2006]KHE71194.1 stage II sporulation protein P [Halobacillus sp. BBL2006]
MPHYKKWKGRRSNPFKIWSKWLGLAAVILLLLFIGIGILTGAKTTYRLYSDTIQEWTTKLKGSSFIYLFEMENRLFADAHPDDNRLPSLTSLSFQLLTSLTPNDPRSLLGREIPGLSAYNSQIIIAGQGTDFSTLPVESEPPLEVDSRGEEGVVEKESPEKPEGAPAIKDDRVYIYHTHNTESFYPHLPDKSTSYDGKVNITLVGKRLGESLVSRGIGATVDTTDVAQILKDRGLEHYQSYEAMRPVVKEVMNQKQSLNFFFDLHRDSVSKKNTTTTIDGKEYARFMFVIGAENSHFEQNLKFATELHKRLEEKYPGISRGVITKKGAGVDGVYNQDLNPNAILIEFGGVENNLDELYRSADVMAEVFSDYYFEDEKVSAD